MSRFWLSNCTSMMTFMHRSVDRVLATMNDNLQLKHMSHYALAPASSATLAGLHQPNIRQNPDPDGRVASFSYPKQACFSAEADRFCRVSICEQGRMIQTRSEYPR